MTTKAQLKAQAVAEAKRVAYAKKVRTLVGPFLPINSDELQRAYDAGTDAEAVAVVFAARSPVGAAVFPLKADAMRSAEQSAREMVARIEAALGEAGWDLNAYAPNPGSYVSREQYRRMSAKRSVATMLTKRVGPDTYKLNAPKIVEMSVEGVERFVQQNVESAAIEYDAFVCKLVAKVGPNVTAAKLEGSHVWAHSILTVTKRDGNETFGERWKTQQIVNVSKLGLLFNQWPTRLMK